MSAAGADNNDTYSNIIFTIKDTRLYVSVVTLPARSDQKLSKRLSKGFERSICWNKYKAKSENINKTNEYEYFLKSNFVGVNRLFVLVYSNQDYNTKRFKTKRHYLPKGIIDNYHVIVNGKHFYDQTIDCDVKRFK